MKRIVDCDGASSANSYASSESYDDLKVRDIEDKSNRSVSVQIQDISLDTLLYGRPSLFMLYFSRHHNFQYQSCACLYGQTAFRYPQKMESFNKSDG